MFNPMAPHELILGVGRVLRMAADSGADAPADDYRRSQLLSAYSVARHLAAEEAAAAELLAWLRAELAAALAADERPAVARARAEVAAAGTGVQVGAALTPLLAELAPREELRARIHRILAEMTEREVAALAAAGS